MEIQREEGNLTFARIEKTSMLIPALQSNQSSLSNLHSSKDQMARSSAYREQLTEEGRDVGTSLLKVENITALRKNPCRTRQRTQKSDFYDLDKPSKYTCQKGTIAPIKQNKEEGQPRPVRKRKRYGRQSQRLQRGQCLRELSKSPA